MIMKWRPPRGGEVDEWTTKLIKERDNFKCLNCGCNERLSIHHLKKRAVSLQESQDYDNLVTLCIDCHCWIHDKASSKESNQFNEKLHKEIRGKLN